MDMDSVTCFTRGRPVSVASIYDVSCLVLACDFYHNVKGASGETRVLRVVNASSAPTETATFVKSRTKVLHYFAAGKLRSAWRKTTTP